MVLVHPDPTIGKRNKNSTNICAARNNRYIVKCDQMNKRGLIMLDNSMLQLYIYTYQDCITRAITAIRFIRIFINKFNPAF